MRFWEVSFAGTTRINDMELIGPHDVEPGTEGERESPEDCFRRIMFSAGIQNLELVEVQEIPAADAEDT